MLIHIFVNTPGVPSCHMGGNQLSQDQNEAHLVLCHYGLNTAFLCNRNTIR